MPRSVNIPFHNAFNADGSLIACPAVTMLNQHRNQVKVVVGGSRGTHANQVCYRRLSVTLFSSLSQYSVAVVLCATRVGLVLILYMLYLYMLDTQFVLL